MAIFEPFLKPFILSPLKFNLSEEIVYKQGPTSLKSISLIMICEFDEL